MLRVSVLENRPLHCTNLTQLPISLNYDNCISSLSFDFDLNDAIV